VLASRLESELAPVAPAQRRHRHPHAALLVRNEKRLLRAVSNMSEYFRTRLGAMRFAGDAEIRVVGLAIGIDLHDEKAAERLGKRCRRKGLLVSPEGETVLLIPALTIDAATAREGLDILEACA